MDILDKRSGKKKSVTLTPNSATYYPEGVKGTMANDADEDLLFLYCAVPASKRDAAWLAIMDEDDIKDVRIREEY